MGNRQTPSMAARFLSSARNGGDNAQGRPATPTTILSYLDTPDYREAKGLKSSDWSSEGPGRRVGYDNLTAIDWIYEYGKERARLRHLQLNSTGWLGQLKQIADASQVWWILIATGIAVGSIAAAIDVASDWLADLKQGACTSRDPGGRFYLNRAFCCWGSSTLAECNNWQAWSDSVGVSNAAGSYVIEYIFFALFSVLFAATASFLVNRYSIYAKQSGIPEIKTVLGGFVIRHFLGSLTLLIKSLGLCLSVASGMWLGKEGPLVHVACCCANLFMKIPLFKNISSNDARKREVLAAAAASGISVAFGAPIGGVLFSLEQLSYYFQDRTMWASFVCAMVAAVTLQGIDPFRTGQLVLYKVTYHSDWHAFELVPFAIVGVLGGLYGAGFINLNVWLSKWRTTKSNPLFGRPVLEVMAVSLLTALTSFPITFLRAQSSELVEYLFAECRDISDDHMGLCKEGIANTGVIFILLASACLGFFLASATFGLQIPSGVLLPSMAIGALYGRVVGLVVEVWQRDHPLFIIFNTCPSDAPCITPGIYAVIGAASALAGATRMTVSIVVIMFELTGALSYVLPIMIAVMIARWVGDAFGERGIYEAWIHLNGYPMLENRDDTRIPDVPVRNIMTRVDDLIVITATGYTKASLQNLVEQHAYRGYPVVDNQRDATLLGYISRTELEFALKSATEAHKSPNIRVLFQHDPLSDSSTALDLRPWMDQTPMTLSTKASLQLANEMVTKMGLRNIMFTEGGRLTGLLTKKDLWIVLNEGNEGDRGHGASRRA